MISHAGWRNLEKFSYFFFALGTPDHTLGMTARPADPAGGAPQADCQLPSPASSTSGQAATDTDSSPQASQGQKRKSNSPPAGRHRANAAVTAAPAKPSTSPSSVHAGNPSQAQGTSDIQQLPQLLSDTQQLLHSNTSDLGQKPRNPSGTSFSSKDQGARLKGPPMSTGETQAATEAGSQAERDPAFQRASELETKLSELTHRLSAAEQAAGPSFQIRSQLLQLKDDKAALQADMKQFMQHTSSMLTTLQAQMSRLMGCSLPSMAPVSAENSCLSAASGQSGKGRPEPALSAQAEGQGRYEPTSPLTSAQARGSIHDWHLESHGSQPSPLANHEIFQSATPSPKHTLHQAGHPKPAASGRIQPGQSRLSMDELSMGLDKRKTQVCSSQEPWVCDIDIAKLLMAESRLSP